MTCLMTVVLFCLMAIAGSFQDAPDKSDALIRTALAAFSLGVLLFFIAQTHSCDGTERWAVCENNGYYVIVSEEEIIHAKGQECSDYLLYEGKTSRSTYIQIQSKISGNQEILSREERKD